MSLLTPHRKALNKSQFVLAWVQTISFLTICYGNIALRKWVPFYSAVKRPIIVFFSDHYRVFEGGSI